VKFIDHIDLSDYSGQCLLTVRDYELFDFLDDYFVEHEIETIVIHLAACGAEPLSYQLLFPLALPKTTVALHLNNIGAEEIERIVRINSNRT